MGHKPGPRLKSRHVGAQLSCSIADAKQRERDLRDDHAAASRDQLERLPDRVVPAVEVQQLVTGSQRDRSPSASALRDRVD